VCLPLRIPRRPGDLAGEYHVRPPTAAGKPCADVTLGGAPGFGLGGRGVHLGGVDEVDAFGQRQIQLLMRIALAVLMPPGHGAQPQDADVDIAVAQLAVTHDRSFFQDGNATGQARSAY
jgi:hypothetical protein